VDISRNRNFSNQQRRNPRMIDSSPLVLCDVVVHCFEICSAVGSGYSKPIKLQKDVVQET